MNMNFAWICCSQVVPRIWIWSSRMFPTRWCPVVITLSNYRIIHISYLHQRSYSKISHESHWSTIVSWWNHHSPSVFLGFSHGFPRPSAMAFPMENSPPAPWRSALTAGAPKRWRSPRARGPNAALGHRGSAFEEQRETEILGSSHFIIPMTSNFYLRINYFYGHVQ
jgi:hypothetical protein